MLKWLGVALLVLATGCADYGGLAYEADGSIPTGAVVDAERVVLPVGATLRILVRPKSRTSVVYDDSAALELVSVDPDIVTAFPDAVEPWRWVIVARHEGETCLDVVVEEALEDCLPVIVSKVAP